MDLEDAPAPVAGAARRAGTSDATEVVSVLVSAFYNDPVWSWMFPDAARRREQHRRFFEQSLEDTLRQNWVWLTPGDTATALWIPPHTTESSPEPQAEFEPMVRDLLGAGADRVFAALELFDAVRRNDEPHFYLDMLGTHEDHRGRGIGLGLLEENLTLVDAAGMPAYLEASNLGNVPLYERYGFRRLASFALPDDGPEFVTMWRDPGGPRSE